LTGGLSPTGWTRLLLFDHDLLIRIRRWERAWATRLMRGLTHLGDTATWFAMTAVLAAAGGDGPHQALLLGAGAGLGVLFSQLLKRTQPASPAQSGNPGLFLARR